MTVLSNKKDGEITFFVLFLLLIGGLIRFSFFEKRFIP